jgi:hypothetical protein
LKRRPGGLSVFGNDIIVCHQKLNATVAAGFCNGMDIKMSHNSRIWKALVFS